MKQWVRNLYILMLNEHAYKAKSLTMSVLNNPYANIDYIEITRRAGMGEPTLQHCIDSLGSNQINNIRKLTKRRKKY